MQVEVLEFPFICRICLHKGILKPLDENSLELLQAITNINIKFESDLLPTNICTGCQETLSEISTFIDITKYNDMFLKHLVLSEQENVKLDEPEEKIFEDKKEIYHNPSILEIQDKMDGAFDKVIDIEKLYVTYDIPSSTENSEKEFEGCINDTLSQIKKQNIPCGSAASNQEHYIHNSYQVKKAKTQQSKPKFDDYLKNATDARFHTDQQQVPTSGSNKNDDIKNWLKQVEKYHKQEVERQVDNTFNTDNDNQDVKCKNFKCSQNVVKNGSTESKHRKATCPLCSKVFSSKRCLQRHTLSNVCIGNLKQKKRYPKIEAETRDKLLFNLDCLEKENSELFVSRNDLAKENDLRSEITEDSILTVQNVRNREKEMKKANGKYLRKYNKATEPVDEITLSIIDVEFP